MSSIVSLLVKEPEPHKKFINYFALCKPRDSTGSQSRCRIILHARARIRSHIFILSFPARISIAASLLC
jgi:hypothetical protein